MTGTAMNDLGRLLLRLALGLLILFHGVSKLAGGPAMGFITSTVDKAGLPAFVAYGVYIGEVVAPVLLVLGLWTRAAALVVAINMLFAVALVHLPQLFTIAQTGGWALELQGMYFFTAIAIVLLGAGRYSVGGAGGRWN